MFRLFRISASLIFFFALTTITAAADENTSTQIITPIIIESDRIDDPPPSSPTIKIPIGIGSKQIDPNTNDLGVEIRTMEGIADFSSERRLEGWRLTPKKIASEWQYRYRADLSLDQKLKTQATKRDKDLEMLVEAGWARDHRTITYMSNSGNLFDSSKNRLSTYPYRKDSGYGKLHFAGASSLFEWRTLLEVDARSENNYAGPNLIGDQDQLQAGLNGSVTLHKWNIIPFFHFKKSQFDSSFNPYLSSATQNPRIGTQADWTSDSGTFSVSNTLDSEWLSRARKDGATTSFHRVHDKSTVKVEVLSLNWIELKGHTFGEAVRDEMTSSINSWGFSPGTQMDFLWDAGAELSTSHRYSVGWNVKVRRFSLMPTPNQKFGDGAILLGASQLPAESGIRVSTGPWWKKGESALSLSAFTEESKNAPIMLAVSPSAARTSPLGGIWTRGIQLEGTFRFYLFQFKSNLTYQDVINASSVSYETGHAIPGRPKYITSNELELLKGRFSTGIRHSFRSTEALDLSGIWFKPPQHRLDTWVGYGRGTWDVRLLGNNLFPNYNLPQTLSFQGTAAPNLLEPNIQQREIRLQCELYI